MPSANLQETVLAAWLHDIGKLLQRAHPSDSLLPPEVRAREAVILPSFKGHATHWHALWTDAFFQWMEDAGLTLPRGTNMHVVRDLAVFHHRPTTGASFIITEADRLASGQDRKPRDEEAEADPGKRRAFREKSLRALIPSLDLGLGAALAASHAATALDSAAIFPEADDPSAQPARYARLWRSWQEGFRALCAAFPDQPGLFEQGLLRLSEQLLWAVPSSTMDQRDVPLHDHAQASAAIAGALFLYHQARGELDSESAIRDRGAPKLRILEGDLSGIQASLFRLKSEQVKGVNRILRARSFLIAITTEAANLLCREELGLPAAATLLSAGGRFRILLPNLEGVAKGVENLRVRLDRWMAERWTGELTVILALTEPFSPALLHRTRTWDLDAIVRKVIERAKLSPLATRIATPILQAPVFGAAGACPSCGVRPATAADSRDPEIRRCTVCHEAHEIGSALPRARGFRLDYVRRLPGRSYASVFDAYELRIIGADEDLLPHASDRSAVASATAFRSEHSAPELLARFAAQYVPRLERVDDPRYRGLSEEARAARVGDLKTFEHLAQDAREVLGNGSITGRAMLGVVKADVDRLGFLFGYGLGEDATPARIATLSRLLDSFFGGYLPDLLRTCFPDTYTVYAGGDDVLLIAPWFDAIRFVQRLHAEFARFSCGNPSLTLSAAVSFLHPNEPLNRAAREAEERLERAKAAGRDRVCLIDEGPIAWPILDAALTLAEELNTRLRAGRMAPTILHALLRFWADKEATEKGRDPARAIWPARYAYTRSRFTERCTKDPRERERLSLLLDRVMGLTTERTPPAPIPISIALWRNR